MSIAAYVCIVWGSFTSRYNTSSYIFMKPDYGLTWPREDSV